MAILTDLWYTLKHGRGWREVRRSMPHPRLGELRFEGRRVRPDGPVDGYWKVPVPGSAHPVGVTFMSEGGEPTPEGLAEVEALLGDLDGLFARSRGQVSAAYRQTVEEPPPSDWRAAFRLDHISLPDREEPEPGWQVSYWCEAAQHWFVVDFRGETVTGVEMEG